MTRPSTHKSYGHRCEIIGPDHYRLSWVVDRYIKRSRLRFPTTYRRDTDEKGARKFCERWGIDLPRGGERA